MGGIGKTELALLVAEQDERNRLERIGTEGVNLSVVASFTLSYERLKPEAAGVFRMLSVFPATFDAEVKEVVCADTGHVQLSDLVRRSFCALREEHEALSTARPRAAVCERKIECRRALNW